MLMFHTPFAITQRESKVSFFLHHVLSHRLVCRRLLFESVFPAPLLGLRPVSMGRKFSEVCDSVTT